MVVKLLRESTWDFICIHTMGLRGGKIHRVGNDTTQVSRGVAKCIKEAKTEKDAMDILEGGLVHMNQTLAEEKNTGTKPSRGEVSYFLCIWG